MNDQELMQQALEALTAYDGTNGVSQRKRVLAALRERLAQPQIQPCAGRNCGSIDPNLHSAECFEDYEKATGAVEWEQVDMSLHSAGNLGIGAQPTGNICFFGTHADNNAEVLRLSKEGIWANPDIPADEAAKLVLAAIDQNIKVLVEKAVTDERNSWPAEMEAMERQVNILTDALAEQPAQQEPIEWSDYEPDGLHHNKPAQQEPVAWWDAKLGVFDEKHFDQLQPLYTSPPAQRKPLTDEQLRSMCKQAWVFETVKQWARVIEAAHNIKENT